MRLRRSTVVACCLTGCFAVALCGAADAPQKPAEDPQKAKAEAAQLDALVKQLSHDDWKTREKAQEELARFGAGAAPRLKELLTTTKDPDLRGRVEGILKQIEVNDASGPTFVTLHLSDATPALAFDELARQAGAKLETQPRALLQRDDLPRVTIHVDRKPFWEALRQLCATCNVRPERSGGGRLLLGADDGTWARQPASISGPFIVTASEAYVTRGIRLGADAAGGDGAGAAPAPPAPVVPRGGLLVGAGNAPAQDHTQVQVEAFFEPKLHGMAWSLGNVTEAADDDGRSILLPRGAEPRRRSTYIGGARSGEWEGTVWLGVASRDKPGARLARLKFLTSFSVQQGVETIEVPDVMAAKDVERIVGPARLVVNGVTRVGNNHYELHVASFPVGDVQQWRAVREGQFRRGPRLLDAAGRELMSSGGSSSMNADSYTSQLRFSSGVAIGGGQGEPAKLVWEVPTAVQQFSVPVEFENLPLP